MRNVSGALVLIAAFGLECQAFAQDPEHDTAAELAWQDYERRTDDAWDNLSQASAKHWQSVSADREERIHVDFEANEIVIEFRGHQVRSPENAAKRASSVVQRIIETEHLLSADELSSGITVLQSAVMVESRDQSARYTVHVKFAPDFLRKRVRKFYPDVKEWSERNHLPVETVLAVIRQESGFNARAKSWVPAYGLMQIVPKYAGREVLEMVTGRASDPTPEFLFDARQNIMVGTTYLRLLNEGRLHEVKDPVRRHVLVICSYNWGPHRIQKLLGQGRLRLEGSVQDFMEGLLPQLPAETRDYVQKVLQYEAEFRQSIKKGEWS